MDPNSNSKCSCENCQLKTLFFTHVSADALTDICDIKREKEHNKGDIIINEGKKLMNLFT